MEPADAETFSHTFLLGGEADLPTLRAIREPGGEARKKRAHRKSRWGCTACKRRKVKCDENAPCSNCEKRRERCSLAAAKPLTPADLTPGALTPTASPPRELNPLPDVDARANLLHLELFHHFLQVTFRTLAFSDLWTEVIQLSFHHEYLMTAILAVSARHLNILTPASPRYSNAALLLLSKSCSQFRADLDKAITVENRDARLGTAILLHYLCWCNVDAPGPAADLSRDQLFLLSEGVRHVRLLSWQLAASQNSIFGRLVKEKRCGALRAMLDGKGLDYRILRGRIMELYDDPQFGAGIPTPPPEEPGPGQGEGEGMHGPGRDRAAEHPFNTVAAVPDPCPQACSDSHILSLLAMQIPHTGRPTPAERELYARLAFEIAADRLAVLLHAERMYEGVEPEPDVREELERAVLSFPLVCYRPFCDLVAAGDSRALAVLYLLYRCAGAFLGGSWWAARRAAVMEEALRDELGRRGLLARLAGFTGVDVEREGAVVSCERWEI